MYGLAIPVHGSTYIVKYVGQASNGNDRCFQHEEEAKKYLAGGGTSNVKKVEMINYYASNGNFKIVILAHKIPIDLLDTMENIYRQMADHGTLLFTISQDEIVFENNLTNIAYTHNNKVKVGEMKVIPMTVMQIENIYANRIYLTSDIIAKKLGTERKVLYALNRPGIRSDDIIGWWRFGKASLASIEWIVLVGNNDMIEYVFSRKDITFIPDVSGDKKGFNTIGLKNHIDKLKQENGDPCFDVGGKGWGRKGFRYL